MIALGVDPTDPRSNGGVCGFAVIEFVTLNPVMGTRDFQQARKLKVIGTLDRGRECDELCEVIDRHHVEAVAVEVALDLYQDAAGKSVKARRAITRALLGQNLMAGELLRTALLWLGREPGVAPRVKRIQSTDWHRVLGVHLRRNPVTGELSETYDAAVRRSIRMWLRNWPAESTAHERDAAGVCLGAFIGP